MSEENVKDPITGAETSSENPVPVPGTDLQNIKPFIQLSNEKIDSEIESNRKQIDELNEKGSDLWNEFLMVSWVNYGPFPFFITGIT